MQKAENLPALAAKGWTAADATALSDAIDALGTTEDDQQSAEPDGLGATAELTRAANDFYDRVLTLQNAANLQWPESNPANTPLRAKFRLDKFPPAPNAPEKKAETTTANPTTSPTA